MLVHGASGGIGSFAVQLAALAGAHVMSTALAADEPGAPPGRAQVVDSGDGLDGPWTSALDSPRCWTTAFAHGLRRPAVCW